MQEIRLYSKKRSVLNYWQKHIDHTYTISVYNTLSEFYDDLEKSQPKVILFDYDGEISTVEELLEYCGSKEIRTHIMVLNSSPLFSDGIRLLRQGAKAFMNAYAKPENLNQAIKAVLEGNIWLYPEFIQAMIKQNPFNRVEESNLLDELSSRQREIAQMVSMGMSNKEIAENTQITEQTVKTHLKMIYEKLHVNTRLELAIMINRVANSY